MEKAITWHMYFQNKSKWRHSMDLKRRLGMKSCIWRHRLIGRWSWFYLHIYAVKYVYFWILQRRLARHWGAGVIHAGSRRGYLKKISRIELCMVDKGFGGRQYQKTTLASNPKRDYVTVTDILPHFLHSNPTMLLQKVVLRLIIITGNKND